MLHKLGITLPVIFIDTLHLFPESVRHALEASRYFDIENYLHIYKPLYASSADDFAKRYGRMLWKSNPDMYDFYAKVEPQRRALYELNAVAWITGRRRDQGGERLTMEILEYDSQGLLTINPLAYWGYHDVWSYIRNFDVPYNPLHDQGYKSIGDIHSTTAVAETESERAGRWKGQGKTECGIHKKPRWVTSRPKRSPISIDIPCGCRIIPRNETLYKTQMLHDLTGRGMFFK
eukprot:TRINITY_DN6521_c0_g1_i1.p1 TRINITY_DN6521_c0_g1~~TRINITY_DN6521_c0_g1_i1.p1  ORF type:complete len:233 (+),score=25.60 TRINITY_DN6521_c0_g1_i1:185-883(+)